MYVKNAEIPSFQYRRAIKWKNSAEAVTVKKHKTNI